MKELVDKLARELDEDSLVEIESEAEEIVEWLDEVEIETDPAYFRDFGWTEAGLGSIWREAAVLWRFREMTPKLKGRCNSCSVRDYCKGCRRIAHFMTGDFYAEDPGCLQDKRALIE